MVGRMIEGVGIGLIGVSAPTCISIWFPDRTKGLALGIWATWFPIGITLMFNIAPSVANAFGWRAVFWVCFIVTMIALVVFALVYRMPQKGRKDIGIEGTFKNSFVYLKNKQVWILGITFFVFNFIQLGVINSFYNTFLETVRGFDGVTAASLTSVVTIISIVAIPVAGAISDRISVGKRKYFIALSYALFLVAFLFAWNTGEHANIMLWVFLIVVGIASGIGGGVSRPLAPILMGGGAMGATVGMSILQFCQNLGATVGAPLFGWGFENLGWEMAGNVIVLPLCALAVAFSLFITSKKAFSSTNSNEASSTREETSALGPLND